MRYGWKFLGFQFSHNLNPNFPHTWAGIIASWTELFLYLSPGSPQCCPLGLLVKLTTLTVVVTSMPIHTNIKEKRALTVSKGLCVYEATLPEAIYKSYPGYSWLLDNKQIF